MFFYKRFGKHLSTLRLVLAQQFGHGSGQRQILFPSGFSDNTPPNIQHCAKNFSKFRLTYFDEISLMRSVWIPWRVLWTWGAKPRQRGRKGKGERTSHHPSPKDDHFRSSPSRIFFAALIVSGGREQRRVSWKGDEVVVSAFGRREVKAINAGKNSHKTRRGMMARMVTGEMQDGVSDT